MKIDPKFKIIELGDESIIVNQGTANVDMTKIISLNKSARLLFEALADREFTVEDAAKVLLDTYEVSEEVALRDAGVWVESLKECGVL